MLKALVVASSLLLSPFLAAPLHAESPSVEAHAARLAGDASRTRFVLDLTAPVEHRAFVLADPFRVVIDLPEITFAMDAESSRSRRGLVQAFRYGKIGPGKSRIVLDLDKPARIDQAFVLPSVDDQPTRLVLDLVGTDEASFRKTVAARPPEAPQPPNPSPTIGQDDDRPLVVIDPGHGGIDSGAVTAGGDLEKAIVLEFARRLAAKIEAAGRHRVLLTRSDDTFVSLQDRVKIAREAKAALFVSIHADTLSDPFGVRGATVYTLSDKASDADAERYAEKENRSDAIAGVDLVDAPDDVADILIDLTRRETKVFSSRFATKLVDEFKAAATLNKNPLRSAGFRVLRAADVPSVLLELGYLSNAQDAKLMLSDEWRDRTTDAVMRAVDAFFAAREGVATAAGSSEELRSGAN